jgi:hypothetical protein
MLAFAAAVRAQKRAVNADQPIDIVDAGDHCRQFDAAGMAAGRRRAQR